MSSKLLRKGTPVEQMMWRYSGPGAEQSELDQAQHHHQAQNRQESGARHETPLVVELESRIALLERKVEEERQKAHRQGYDEGLLAGKQEEADNWAHAQRRLAKAVEETSKAKVRFRSESEDDVVKLSFAIARKILNRELSVDPEALGGLVSVAMTKLNQRELHRVRVHPADVKAVEQVLHKNAGPIRIEVQGDPALERGAAIFETERGILDASVTAQLKEIERGLADLLTDNS